MRGWVDVFILVFFLALNSFYAVLIIVSIVEIARRKAARLPELDDRVMSEESTPPVTVIAPAYNEAATIVDSVRAFLQLEYPSLSVVVVNDGSTDDTLARLIEEFDLTPVDQVFRSDLESTRPRQVYRSTRHEQLSVIDKENGGKADALNLGINAARTPLICCVDADTIVERKALLRMVEPFLYDPAGVVAVGGTVRLANGCAVDDGVVERIGVPESWLARFQIVEYLRGFLFGRMGLNRLGGNLIISGAFGLFLREAVVEVGGYEPTSIGEDMELVVKLQRQVRLESPPRHIVHVPEPIAFTEAPESFGVLARQRDRWQRGMADSLMRHRAMFLRPAYGSIGLFVFPIFVFFELLGPVVELFGYGWFAYLAVDGAIDPHFAILFALVAFLWGMLLSVQAVLIDNWSFDVFKRAEDRRGLLAAALLENFGYRQMTLLFRIWGLVKYLVGARSWGRMDRRGFERDEEREASNQPLLDFGVGHGSTETTVGVSAAAMSEHAAE